MCTSSDIESDQHALPMCSIMWHARLAWGVSIAAMTHQTAEVFILSLCSCALLTDCLP